MGCNTYLTANDSKLFWQCVEALKNAPPVVVKGLDPKIWEECREAVEQELEKVTVRILQENATKNLETAKSRFEGRDPTPLEKLDMETEATEKDYKTMFKVGRGLGMSELEIMSTPEILGTKGVEDMEGKTREVMDALHNSKIDPVNREEYTVNRVLFVDPKSVGLDEKGDRAACVFPSERYALRPELLRTIFVFPDENGNFPTGADLKVTLAHEIFHLNETKFMQTIAEHAKEWRAAALMELQAKQTAPSVLQKHMNIIDTKLQNREISKSQFDAEIIPDYYALHVMTEECPKGMSRFFEKYF